MFRWYLQAETSIFIKDAFLGFPYVMPVVRWLRPILREVVQLRTTVGIVAPVETLKLCCYCGEDCSESRSVAPKNCLHMSLKDSFLLAHSERAAESMRLDLQSQPFPPCASSLTIIFPGEVRPLSVFLAPLACLL